MMFSEGGFARREKSFPFDCEFVNDWIILLVICRDEKKDFSTAILQRKKSPNRLLVDEVSARFSCPCDCGRDYD